MYNACLFILLKDLLWDEIHSFFLKLTKSILQVTAACPLGTPSYGSWDTSSCVANSVTCPADEYTATSCTSGSGTACRWYSYVGASCTRTYMGIDESGCTFTPPSCPSCTVFSSSCGTGYSGSMIVTTTYSGRTCDPATTIDNSGCTPNPIPRCTPGVDMQISVSGVCIDRATYPWNRTSITSNYSAESRACYSWFNTNGD